MKLNRATCPVDEWAFTPRYTDGKCPLCGWRPEGGLLLARPWFSRVHWLWPALAGMALVSVAMGILVVVAYRAS